MFADYRMLRAVVRALRIQRGWTQEEGLAEKAGLDYKHYQLFESAHTATPTLKLIESLAGAFGVAAWELLCEDAKLVRSRLGVDVRLLPEKTRSGRPRKSAVANEVKLLFSRR